MIVSTYNWPSALKCVLDSLHRQSVAPFEIIVADDGSSSETGALVAGYEGVKHVWHKDEGFRLAQIRNRALLSAAGDWIVFLDGDCICPPHFVAQHQRLACAESIVAGNRRLLSPTESEFWLSGLTTYDQFVALSRADKLSVWPGLFYRDWMPRRWQKVRGCNIGIGRTQAMEIAGFDESYQGWGKEDSDFAIRAINSGLKVRLGQNAVTVLHIHHAEADRSGLDNNQARLASVIQSNRVMPQQSMLLQ